MDSVGAYNEKYVELDHRGFTLDYEEELFTIYDADEYIITKLGDFNEEMNKMCELVDVGV
ncbi:hypothetical protein CR203_21675 [Salipaludibacillus neizhouensis]|uniref:Uncharacterized protein n=1 Tax=Salipaludibacillus neizhouensis TaxID=885475 RepID=A0A3A9K6L7_9BACI|nr:hypothetical protein [Salipaludibacillus neizhouensis]RKL65283.1 hypothetical protein CR203_21675 [Salipaludibacillus neizhouensis]